MNMNNYLTVSNVMQTAQNYKVIVSDRSFFSHILYAYIDYYLVYCEEPSLSYFESITNPTHKNFYKLICWVDSDVKRQYKNANNNSEYNAYIDRFLESAIDVYKKLYSGLFVIVDDFDELDDIIKKDL